MFVNFIDVSDAKKLFSYRDILENTQDVVIVTGASYHGCTLGPNDYLYKWLFLCQNHLGEVTHVGVAECDLLERKYLIEQFKTKNTNLKSIKHDPMTLVEERSYQL